MAELAPGSHFGEFVITRALGSGAMGLVYEAEQTSLGRSVALKIMRPEFCVEPQFRERFLREARSLAKMDSPHIITIFSSGEVEGRLYLATQLVTGGDLGARLRVLGGLPPQDALKLVSQLCAATQQAHEAGILHRDIKPSNVLMRRSGELHAYLCDFGIARLSDVEETMTTGALGTLAYMSPERLDGERASPASDIYALGCLLHAALTGVAPYTGTATHVIRQHVSGDVPQLPLTIRGAEQINAILARAMAKAPGDRYASASAMGADLVAMAQWLSQTSTSQTLLAPAPTPRGDDTIHRSQIAPRPAPPAATPAPPPEPAAQAPSTAAAGGSRSSFGALAASAAALAVAVVILAYAVMSRGPEQPSEPSAIPPKGTPTATAPEAANPDPPSPSPAKEETAPLDPLDIGSRFANRGCSGEFLVLLQISGDASNRGVLRDNAQAYPNARYLKNADSCSSFRARDTDTGDEVYSLYLGPFPSIQVACSEVHQTGVNWARVKKLTESASERELCFCLESADSLPTIGGDGFSTSSANLREIQEFQWGLMEWELVGRNEVHGDYTSDFINAVARAQVNMELPPTGVVDTETWRVAQREFCNGRLG